ncbi:MAG: tRNA (adenosine(37)-N6)-threonylcarbamoyltransferase complex dimerization subunit type 1 TsaB [Candidatus Saccharimonadales bacterium]|jgi:tRNA threonylcarbamoyladenosine biosynthesis protein TsaB
MLILTLRTDKPEAEIGLYEGEKQLGYDTWLAHRQLAETLLQKITTFLQAEGRGTEGIQGIVCFEGPGSFTGLRIGISVGNALAYGLGVPIVGAQGDEWQIEGITELLAGHGATLALPFYGAPVHITEQKK